MKKKEEERNHAKKDGTILTNFVICNRHIIILSYLRSCRMKKIKIPQ